MRTTTKFLLISCILAGAFFAYSKKIPFRPLPTVSFKTASPTRRDIVRKKVFTGSIIPHKEIKIASHITGLIDKLLVNVGDYVQQGAAIAQIRIQPNTKEIERAESRVRLAAIQLNQCRNKYLRNKQLFSKKMLAKEAYESSLADWEQAKEKASAAEKDLQIVQRGYTKEKGAGANIVRSTTRGTVLDLPVKEGSLVQTASSQSLGTPVAVIGDMNHFLFSAKVSELDVIHLTKGMSFEISLNASKEDKFQVTLTKISPKASEADLKKGEVKFAIEGIIHKPKHAKLTLRAGYLALAEIVVERASNVIAIQEKMIQIEGKTYFVNCLVGGVSVKKKVVLGVSDGLYAEVKQGLTEKDQLIIAE